ncbi:MAG: helix-turn-helix domain-containing protein [Beijerinckiaceae bacterium]|nr:helix-turn-helix domain-containing protein [Beijerinckiaceae bacterium]
MGGFNRSSQHQDIAKGTAIRAIARKLARSPSTISREVRRGLSGFPCEGGHTGPDGGSRWHDAKPPASLTRFWTSFCPAPIRRRPSTPMGCSTI